MKMLNKRISASHRNIICQIFTHILAETAIKSEAKNRKEILIYFRKILYNKSVFTRS